MNFTAYNPTKLHFGKGVVKELGAAASDLGKHALLVYGGGSVHRNGSYADTLAQLSSHGIRITEFSGIKPNPVVEDANAAAGMGKMKGVDMVVAVGGGSVIDTAKISAICIADGHSAWKVMKQESMVNSSLPVIAVLTLAATGSEMNPAAVLQNHETGEKIGLRNDAMYPVHSFLDPSYTLTVPADYTAYGIVDMMAHCLEAWFGEGDASLSDRFVIGILNEALENGPALMLNLSSYELREKIMWAATCALNNTTLHGRKTGDWGAHRVSHVLSYLYDTPHGAALSIIYPAWLRAMRERAGSRIERLGKELFGTSSVDVTIQSLEDFFRSLGSPVRCQEAGIEPSVKNETLELMNRNRVEGLCYKLSDKEREEILSYAW